MPLGTVFSGFSTQAIRSLSQPLICHRLVVATSGHLLQQQNEPFKPQTFFCHLRAADHQSFQLGLFFFGQCDFQTDFFIVRTQIDSSILSNFRCGRGYSGVSPGNGFWPVGGEVRCSLFLWTGYQRVRVFCCHSEFRSHLLLQLLTPRTEFFLEVSQKSCFPRANKETGYIHNRTSRMPSPRWCLFWFVYITGLIPSTHVLIEQKSLLSLKHRATGKELPYLI